MTDFATGEIPASLGQLTNLTHLDIGSNQLSGKQNEVGDRVVYFVAILSLISAL